MARVGWALDVNFFVLPNKVAMFAPFSKCAFDFHLGEGSGAEAGLGPDSGLAKSINLSYFFFSLSRNQYV